MLNSCKNVEIIKIGLSSHKMYSNNIPKFQESTSILNACTKKSGNLLNVSCIFYNYKAFILLSIAGQVLALILLVWRL